MGEVENGPIANTYGGVAIAFSPDGLHWTEWPGPPVIHHGTNLADAPTMLGWDRLKKKYVAYPRPGHPKAPEVIGTGVHRHIRTIGYAESDDFIHWTPTQPMIQPGAQDRVDYQFGQFTAGIVANQYVGFLMVHQTHEQTWAVFLLTSRDGFHWNWADHHTPFMVRGEVGTYDAGYQDMCGPILHDGTVFLYYGAYGGAHSDAANRRGTGKSTIALATMPEDRWVGLLAGPDVGTITTKPLFFRGSRLFVDLDASVPQKAPTAGRRNFDECELRGAVLDQSGGPLEGFSMDRSNLILRSGVQEMKWEGSDLSKLEGKPVRLRFSLRAGALYSIRFA
jgi:hypothetical protein